MRKSWITLLGLMAILIMAVPAMAQTTVSEQAAKGITMQDWKDSSLNEKYAFLLGMATMVEMEKYWQATRNESIINQWAAGFADPTFKQIVDKVDGYLITNPGATDKYLLEVLWYQVVDPKRVANQ